MNTTAILVHLLKHLCTISLSVGHSKDLIALNLVLCTNCWYNQRAIPQKPHFLEEPIAPIETTQTNMPEKPSRGCSFK